MLRKERVAGQGMHARVNKACEALREITCRPDALKRGPSQRLLSRVLVRMLVCVLAMSLARSEAELASATLERISGVASDVWMCI